jgi:DNA topoisomerase-2
MKRKKNDNLVDPQGDTHVEVEDKYQIKDEISHILDRSGMWIGSTINDFVQNYVYVPSRNKFLLKDMISHNAGLEKVIDEVFTNSIDEYRRSKTKAALFDITQINVTLNSDGTCIIEDNGGIPVVIHKETGEYVPKMIFGMLRTSSNYDDSENKEWVGTNGLGAKVTNIFSEWFVVETCDGKNAYKCRWENNMKVVSSEEVTKSGGSTKNAGAEHYTRVSFKIDLNRFDLEKIDTGNIRLFQKHCIDAAAANPGLIVNFVSDIADGKLNGSWKFENFQEYVKLYVFNEINEEDMLSIKSGSDDMVLWFGSGIENIGFVNGALCCKGTHIKKIQKQITDVLVSHCHKNGMDLITEKDVLSRFSVFVSCTIHNPVYDSQAKTCLATKIEPLKLRIENRILTLLKESNLMIMLNDYYNIKYKEQKKKELRSLNNIIKSTKSRKLIAAGVVDPTINELWLFEGTSASSGFRKARNYYQAAYLLRGKVKNTVNLGRSQILDNVEFREILAILGLQFEKPEENIKKIRFSKIVICTDADHDGAHICGLLLAFFSKHFPELFASQKIFIAQSPIIIAEKGAKAEHFYNQHEWDVVKDKYTGYDITYTKGLGGLKDADYKNMLQSPKLLRMRMEKEDSKSVDVWFDTSTDVRKELIMLEG